MLLPSHERSTAFTLMKGKGANDTSLAEVGIVMGVLLCKCAPQINAVAPAHLFDLASYLASSVHECLCSAILCPCSLKMCLLSITFTQRLS